MRQFLFVVKKGRIAFWKFQRGCLSRMSLNGNDWNAYNSAFWDEWCGANLPEDFEDAILLSDRPDEPVELPSWFNRPDNEASKWTLETFSKIVNDGEFAGKGVGIYLGTKKYVFASGSPEENFWFYPREGNLCTQLGEVKEKQIQRAVAEEQEKNRTVEELKKRKVELARKRAEEESRTERQKKGSSRKEKVSKKRDEEQYNYEEYLQSQFAVAKAKSTRDGGLVKQDRTVGRQKKVSLRKEKLSKQGDEEQFEKLQKDQRAAEVEKKRQADEARRVQEVFESGPVKQLFSAWERLCGAYSKILPALTYQLHQACRNCARGIVLPRNYLKDVALKFISGSVSPSFQGRGEAESVKDRGAVLGILLLHYIGSSDFNPYGEEAEDLRQIYQLAQRQSIQDRLVAHVQKYHEIEC